MAANKSDEIWGQEWPQGCVHETAIAAERRQRRQMTGKRQGDEIG